MMKRTLATLLCLGSLRTIGVAADHGVAPAHLKDLTALTKVPVEIQEAPELPCAVGGGGAGTFPTVPTGSKKSPHRNFSIMVHVNQVLLDYLRKNPGGTKFPIGSVLLKEKFAEGTKTAHLYTRMERKTLKDNVEDWEFSAKSLDGSEDPRSFKASRCMNCHDDFKDTGFVSDTSVSQMESFLHPDPVPDANPPN